MATPASSAAKASESATTTSRTSPTSGMLRETAESAGNDVSISTTPEEVAASNFVPLARASRRTCAVRPTVFTVAMALGSETSSTSTPAGSVLRSVA